ncbi:MAG: hypothetical protein ABID63_10980 [Pseudomonadota bacterium]
MAELSSSAKISTPTKIATPQENSIHFQPGWGKYTNQFANGTPNGYPSGVRVDVPLSTVPIIDAFGDTSWTTENIPLPHNHRSMMVVTAILAIGGIVYPTVDASMIVVGVLDRYLVVLPQRKLRQGRA